MTLSLEELSEVLRVDHVVSASLDDKGRLWLQLEDIWVNSRRSSYDKPHFCERFDVLITAKGFIQTKTIRGRWTSICPGKRVYHLLYQCFRDRQFGIIVSAIVQFIQPRKLLSATKSAERRL